MRGIETFSMKLNGEAGPQLVSWYTHLIFLKNSGVTLMI